MLTLSIIALPPNTLQLKWKFVMETNNKLSESLSCYEPVHPFQRKGNHTPQDNRKYLKKE